MDIEINFNSEWGFEEKVEHMFRLVLGNQLEIKQENQKIMADIAELDAEIQSVADTNAKAVTDIKTAVEAAADRVINSLKNTGLDLSPEIAVLENLKTSTAAAAASVTGEADAIDPAPVVAPEVIPIVEAPATETSTNDGLTAGDATGVSEG